MGLEAFDYELAPEHIAQTPVEPRDAARLLVDRGASRPPEHRRVRDLPDLLRRGDLVVVNETRVIPARLHVHRASGGAAEVLLLEPLAADLRRWDALVRPGRKLREGERLQADDGQVLVEVGPRQAQAGTREVRLVPEGEPLDLLHRYGEVPLPPYISEKLADPERYQTVYARPPGSVAAPTAGLHLTRGVLERLGGRGIGVATVELVVGLDTFRPIAVDDPADHEIHTERYRVPEETMAACEQARASGGRVVAVGTTSTRALETAAGRGELAGRTDLFIRRGHSWQVVDLLLTNFHLPRTTLLLLVDSFVGDRWRTLYDEALARGYRFLSFGDAMLLDRAG